MILFTILFGVSAIGVEIYLSYQIYTQVLAHSVWGIVYWGFWSWLASKIAAGVVAMGKESQKS